MRTKLCVVSDVGKFKKHFGVSTTWLACRHLLWHASAAPPILLGVIVKDATALHAYLVAIFFAADLDFFCLNPFLRKEFFPQSRGFGVFRDVVFLVADESGHIELVRIDADLFCEELKHPFDLIFLEIIAERPIAEHLKKSGVAIVADFININGAERLLRIRNTCTERMRFAEQVRHHWLHAGTGEESCWVVLRHERRRRNNGMAPLLKEFQIPAADVVGFH